MRSRVILSRIIFFLYLVAIGILLFMSGESLPHVTRTMFGFPTDKVVHFMMFLPFPILAFLSSSYVAKKWWQSILYVLLLFAIGCAIAAITETVQGMLGTRTADIKDFDADIIALGISSVLVMTVDLVCLPAKKKSLR